MTEMSDYEIDTAWRDLAESYGTRHLFELRVGLFGGKGLSEAMHFQQQAVIQDASVEEVINDTLKEAVDEIQSGERVKVRQGKRSFKKIAKALRWFHPDAIKKMNFALYRNEEDVGPEVSSLMKQLVSKALYSVARAPSPELGRLIYKVYMRSPEQAEPTESELKEWIEILDAIEDEETHIEGEKNDST